jgi:hypothetical protein
VNENDAVALRNGDGDGLSEREWPDQAVATRMEVWVWDERVGRWG